TPFPARCRQADRPRFLVAYSCWRFFTKPNEVAVEGFIAHLVSYVWPVLTRAFRDNDPFGCPSEPIIIDWRREFDRPDAKPPQITFQCCCGQGVAKFVFPLWGIHRFSLFKACNSFGVGQVRVRTQEPREGFVGSALPKHRTVHVKIAEAPVVAKP